ncbi:MAG: flagellar export protein FliJ [Clostridiales Family XIII bacterium]|jgi:flagellar export protein FliJ|nr:flagellar export protein FliJ [Clostridiales Family XIII bacterium]
MKKFDFKLDKLMSYKEQTLGNERMTLGALNGEMERTQARLDALTAEKEKCAAEMEAKRVSGELTPLGYQLYHKYDVFLKEEINAVKRVKAQIQARIDKQVEVLKNIKLETKSLETVKQSKLASYRKEEVKDAEHLLDEFVNTARAMRRVSV